MDGSHHSSTVNGACTLGIDLGSHFTKLAVAGAEGRLLFRKVIPTLSRRRESLETSLSEVHEKYPVQATCSTGYGRHTVSSDRKVSEIVCAAIGVSAVYPVDKTIIDIGGEDIKVIECGARGEVGRFYMNDKCSAGTGAFITEIAEKAELEISEMSDLARRSDSDRVMNSFCTVFAKTEILAWKFDGVPIEDMSRGIYLSIVDRICKLPVRTDVPIYLSGGVAAYHPYVTDLMSERLGVKVEVAADPQYMVALGAAILANRGRSLSDHHSS